MTLNENLLLCMAYALECSCIVTGIQELELKVNIKGTCLPLSPLVFYLKPQRNVPNVFQKLLFHVCLKDFIFQYIWEMLG